ncbi:MAG TPA: hemolysin family protein [Longimicrobiaceae bacterium]|nr:hemolysin family protein [Longimicrobiaceae bacterium]
MRLLPFLVVAVLIALTALYVAAEFAAVSVRRTRIRQRAEQGDALAATLLRFISDPVKLDRYISASQMGITVTSLLVGAYAQGSIAVQLVPVLQRDAGLSPVAAHSVATVIVLSVLTILQMVLSELVPKYLALQKPTEVALFTVLPVQWSLTAFSWFLTVLNGSAALVLKAFGMEAAGHGHIHSPEEIDLLIAESRDGGLLEPDEHRRLRRALQLGIRPARHLMVPRPQIAAIDIDLPLERIRQLVAESAYTRLPVYRGGIDHVIGTLHTRDLFTRLLDPEPLTSVEPLLRPILMVHESIAADRLLTRMRERRSHQALVLDEFGGVSGLVTLDDVLTEVMGDFGDEFKTADPRPEVLADGRVRLPGQLRLDEAEPWIGVFLDGESDTVGGRVTEALGHLPEPGERVTVCGVEMEVEAVVGHAVASVLAAPLEEEREEERDG